MTLQSTQIRRFVTKDGARRFVQREFGVRRGVLNGNGASYFDGAKRVPYLIDLTVRGDRYPAFTELAEKLGVEIQVKSNVYSRSEKVEIPGTNIAVTYIALNSVK